MKLSLRIILLPGLCVAMAFSFAACGNGDSASEPTATSTKTTDNNAQKDNDGGGGNGGGAFNSAPVADAGADQNVVTGSLATMDGSGSSDPDRDLITYGWSFYSKPSGSIAILSNATIVNPSFRPDRNGRYVLNLVVSDGSDDSAADIVIITASTTNSPPVAYAGTDQNVTPGDIVTLDGSWSSDANGDLITYGWAFTLRPGGSSAALSNAAIVNPAFTADLVGLYVLSLIVNDGIANSSPDFVAITSAVNSVPVARAGADQNVLTGSLVTLNGSTSSDADGDPLTYLWDFISKPGGSTAALSSSTVVNPTFTPDLDGSYVLGLIVNDGIADSATDVVTITAASAPNSAPVANAGPDQPVSTGSFVTLDGSASSDADGDPLTYAWTFTSKPGGSIAALSSSTVVNPTFTADLDGAYVFSLVVNDGTVNSAADTVTVTSATANSAPVANAGPDQSVATGSLVTLDGSGSSDADRDPLTYAWTLVSKPGGSTAALSSATAVSPTFTADLAGSYVLNLVVNDGTVDSAADFITITVGP